MLVWRTSKKKHEHQRRAPLGGGGRAGDISFVAGGARSWATSAWRREGTPKKASCARKILFFKAPSWKAAAFAVGQRIDVSYGHYMIREELCVEH